MFSNRICKITFAILTLICVTGNLCAESVDAMVVLKDKNGSEFDPYTYFDQKAIDRYHKMDLDLYDISNFPVSPAYLNILNGFASEMQGCSRWHNAVFLRTDIENLDLIRGLSFVNKVITNSNEQIVLSKNTDMDEDYDSFVLENQISHLQGDFFAENQFTGKGIRIAIFDAGFPNVDDHPAFKHIREANRIIKTYDFAKRKEYVYKYSSHGTSVLSCIAGVYDTNKLGLAIGAEFLLARTELSVREPFSEEKNWMMAVEWADKNGADIINSSLGYTVQRYFPKNMDGLTSYVSGAARIAVRKGMLVVNAAGNSGEEKWKVIGTPADVDSVLSIGGIDPYTNYHMGFSSYGPNYKKQMKPNVSAFAQVIAADKEGLHETFGTSFASPLIAGFAACVWQMHPEWTNMDVFSHIEKSGNLYPYFDYAHGYGVPQAEYFDELIKDQDTTFDVQERMEYLNIVIREDFLDSNVYNNVEEAIFKSYDPDYFYYHIEGLDGSIRKYFVLNVYQPKVLRLYKYEVNEGEIARFHFKGYTGEFKF